MAANSRSVPLAPLLSISALLLPFMGCSNFAPPAPSWRDGLVADSPCYNVDLLNGLDESSSDEVRDLFDCVNHHGHVAALEPTAAGLDTTTRDGVPVGVATAQALNRLADTGLDPFAAIEPAVELLRREDEPLIDVLDIAIELSTGEAAADVRLGAVSYSSPEVLAGGVLVPLDGPLRAGARELLDDDLRLAAELSDTLKSSDTARLVHTLNSLVQQKASKVAGPRDRLLEGLGDVLAHSRDTSNDHWSQASGDSLQDLMDALLLGSNPTLDAITPEARRILADDTFRRRIVDRLVELQEDGHLAELGDQVAWMASVDTAGNPVSSGDDSGLTRFVRLLATTNRPMTCSVPIFWGELDIDLGNVSVTLLETIADWNPDNVQGSAGLVSEVLGWSFSEWALDGIAESGNCSAITPQVVDDLAAVDLLGREEADDLVVVFLALLVELRDADNNHIPDLADAATTLHNEGAVPPLEEALKDAGPSPFLDDVFALLPVLAAPQVNGLSIPNGRPVDLDEAMDALQGVFEGSGGPSGWERTKPLIQAVVSEQGTFDALYNLSGPLTASNATLPDALGLLPVIVELDPHLEILNTLGTLIGQEEVARPFLSIVEQPAITSSLLATQPQSDQEEVPLAMVNRLVVAGAVDDLLSIIDLLLTDLGSPDAP